MLAYKTFKPYFGDLHNHCEVGYGHGTLENSFQNAKLQLDFVAVTVHAHWHDIPAADERLKDLVDYHLQGFQKAADGWQNLREMVKENYVPGEFVTFVAFEWLLG